MSNPQEYKALRDISAECAIMSSCYRGEEPICSCRVDRGIPKADSAGGWDQPAWEWVAKSFHSGWPRDSVHLWHRLFQKRVFQGPKKSITGLSLQLPWRQGKLGICLPGIFSQRTLLLWGGWGITGATHHHNGAPAEMLHQLDCPGILRVMKD